MSTQRLIGEGVYPLAQAARLTDIAAARIRRWTSGYSYVYRGQRRTSPPVVHARWDPLEGAPILSFRDLQEVRVLDAFRTYGVSWHVLRLASERAKELIRSDHPFSTGRFRSFGNSILTALETGAKDAALVDILSNQLVLNRIIAPYLRGVEFRDDNPVRWFPRRHRRIVLDPERHFGQPVVNQWGVPTLALLQAFKAERSYERVARWYEIDIQSVKAAVEYERQLAA